MRRAVVISAVLMAAGALVTAIAQAVTVRDRDDVTTGLDIAKASGTHNRASDQLVHVVETYEGFAPADLVNKDKPPSSICIEIWTTSKPGESPANYEACATPAAKGQGWKASVARARKKGPRLRVASVQVEQPASTRLVMRFDPDSIRRPSSYRWRAETTSFRSDCRQASGCQDYAPDRPDTAETRLGAPRG
ncbi:MAG: hypothetical protein ACJ76Z_16145 [Thermoleophilaceae bacterium]